MLIGPFCPAMHLFLAAFTSNVSKMWTSTKLTCYSCSHFHFHLHGEFNFDAILPPQCLDQLLGEVNGITAVSVFSMYSSCTMLNKCRLLWSFSVTAGQYNAEWFSNITKGFFHPEALRWTDQHHHCIISLTWGWQDCCFWRRSWVASGIRYFLFSSLTCCDPHLVSFRFPSLSLSPFPTVVLDEL